MITETTVEQMRERHKKEIEDFQANCQHPKTQWLLYCWIEGHFTGEISLCCEVCQKELERKKMPDDWGNRSEKPTKYGDFEIYDLKMGDYVKQANEELARGIK
jgi:hypothetical protein